MTSIIIILLLLPLLFLLLQRQKKNKIANIRLPPGPKGLVLVGNLHQIDNSKPHYSLWKLSKQYGPLMSMHFGFVPTLIVSSAKMAKEIFKNHDLQFSGRPTSLGRQMLSYDYLDLAFTPYNDYWKEMRKACVVHLFNSTKVQCFRPIREDEVSRLIEKISKSSVASKPVNLSELMVFVSSTITCRLTFGKRYEDDEIERSRFHDLFLETEVLFIRSFFSDYFPVIGRWLDKFTGNIRRLEKNFMEWDKFYEELIDDHLNPQRPKTKQEDFLDDLIQIQRSREFTFDLTWNHIKGLLMNVFLGGTGTTAAVVIWAMVYLMKNPKVMKKAQEEIRCLIGNDKGLVDEDDVQKLNYLKAIVKETMRLQPVGPLLIPRETTEDCIVDGYQIAAKTTVFVNAWAMGRDPEVWKNPEEFDPDRFIGSPINFKGQHYELIPFGSGRRICPGMSMGVATVELSLANLLYKFNWEAINKDDLDTDSLPGLAMHKKNPLWLMPRNCN